MNKNEEIEQYIQEINSYGFEKKMHLSTKELAKILGVSPSSIDNWRKQGISIDYIEIGSRILFPKRAIAEFLARKRIKTV